MAVTCCLLPFTKVIGHLPLDRERWRQALRGLPKECPTAGRCSPGGCQKHCAEYASGAWLQRSNEPKQTKPPKTTAKGKKR